MGQEKKRCEDWQGMEEQAYLGPCLYVGCIILDMVFYGGCLHKSILKVISL